MKRVLQSRLRSPRWTYRRYASDVSPAVAPIIPTSIAKDDALLRTIFDVPAVWETFKTRTSTQAGLFLNHHLTHPNGFKEFSNTTLHKAQELVEQISSGQRQETVIKDLDRLSDMLCSVSDLTAFIRTVHPDPKYAEAANETFNKVLVYMNRLNRHRKLYELTQEAVPHSYEEVAVQKALLHDFEQSGMNLSDDQTAMNKFVSLSSEVLVLEQKFIGNMRPAQSSVELDVDEVQGMYLPHLRNIISERKVKLPTSGMLAQAALSMVENESARRRIWEAQNTGRKDQIERLERLLVVRQALAKLTQYKTYAEAKLADKMAKTPDAVMNFLLSLDEANRPLANKSLRPLKREKLKQEGNENIEIWDRNYYQSLYERQLENDAELQATPLHPFLSVGTVIQGLSRLFDRLYGIRFVPKEPQLGEVWHEDVRRVDVHDENGLIGIIYCDLFGRPGKEFSPPAHYTIRCSRQVGSEDADGAIVRNGYQLPIIALVCDFKNPSRSEPSCLSWTQVETLFHEMGHAMHSMIARTDFHNIAGTRCSTDFVELPSVLMEHFCTAPSVLPLFARHWKNDVPLSYNLLQRYLKPINAFRALGTQYQIFLSILDMTYHTQNRSVVDTTTIARDLFNKYNVYPPLAPDSPVTLQMNFSHLFPYGALYYSYLFDRAIASKIWKEVFEPDPLSREAGQKYLEEVLKWGGARDGWECVAAVLGRSDLKYGGKEAMEQVGQWGIEGH